MTRLSHNDEIDQAVAEHAEKDLGKEVETPPSNPERATRSFTAPTRELIEEPCEFWFVWTKYGHVPHFAHETAFRAEAEAERLARANPGQKYIVLRAYTKMRFAAPAPQLEEVAA